MNATRRKELNKLVSELEDIKTRLETLQDEEIDYFENMPESLQSSERGQQTEGYLDTFVSAVDNIEQTISDINDLL